TARLHAEAVTGREQPILDDKFIADAKQVLETGTQQDRQRLLEYVGRVPRTAEERQRLFRQLGKTSPELGQLAYYSGALNSDGRPDPVKRQIAADAMSGLDWYRENPVDTVKEQQARHAVNAELMKVVKDPKQVSGLSRMAFGLMVENARQSGQFGRSTPREFTSTDARRAVGRLIG